jgi:hypothetical protein
MAFKMKGAPYLKSAFKDGGHGGELYHTHQTEPVPGAPTAKPDGGYLTQEVVNKMAMANERAAKSPSNDKRSDKSGKRKSKIGQFFAKVKKNKGKRPKKGDNVTYKCTSKGCSAMD